MTLVAQNVRQQRADAEFVVYNKDGGHGVRRVQRRGIAALAARRQALGK
jgi:hypothetical protein